MQDKNQSRRSFLRNSSLAAAALVSIPQLASASYAAHGVKRKKIALNNGDVILFQGDSITDASRKKDDLNFNSASALGNGYAMIAASELLFRHADKGLKIFNKGISGNKVYQLAERWQKDALDLRPQVLSILIGVNDYWHRKLNLYKGTPKIYRDDYDALLTRTKEKYPNIRFIIGEPFALKGIKAVDESWFPEFDEYRRAARELADKFDAVFIPYQSIYEEASRKVPGVHWTYDGVHPSLAGAHLMAHSWLQAIK